MFPRFLSEEVDLVAERLLGCVLERTIAGERLAVRIVETESYDESDPASHTFRGRTPRNEVMFGQSGHLYVYLSYGMHFCCNVVAGAAGHGAAVLIRAGEPVEGSQTMERLRGRGGFDATNGPGKLCQALSIDLELNGQDLREKPLRLLTGELRPDESVTRATRIGITKAADLNRRFYVTGNPWVSQVDRRPRT